MSRLAKDLEDALSTDPGAEAESDDSNGYVVIEEFSQDGVGKTTIIGQDISYHMDGDGNVTSHPFHVSRDDVIAAEFARADKRVIGAYKNREVYILEKHICVAKLDLPFDISDVKQLGER